MFSLSLRDTIVSVQDLRMQELPEEEVEGREQGKFQRDVERDAVLTKETEVGLLFVSELERRDAEPLLVSDVVV